MKRIFLLLAILVFFCTSAFARGKYSSYVQAGGKSVKTSSISTYLLMETFPSSTVTVYLAGTTTLASIYSNSTGTVKANPFTADTKAYFEFYADNGFYDVKFSGTGITSPWTISYITIIDPQENFNPLSFGAKCDNSTDDLSAFNAIVTLAGSSNITISVPKLGPCRLSTITFPANISFDFSSSGGLYARDSNTITIFGDMIGPTKIKRFYNGEAGQGTFAFTGNYYLDILYPEWWGAKGNNVVDCSGPVTATIAASQSVTQPHSGTAGVPIQFGVGQYKFVTGVSYTAANNASIVIKGRGQSSTLVAGGAITILTVDQGNSSFQGLEISDLDFNLDLKDAAGIKCTQCGQMSVFRNLWINTPSSTGTKKLLSIAGEIINLENIQLEGSAAPRSVADTNVGLFIDTSAHQPYKIWMKNIHILNLYKGISVDNTIADGASFEIVNSSFSGCDTGIDIGGLFASNGVAEISWTISKSEFEGNNTNISANGFSGSFPLQNLAIMDNHFTGMITGDFGIKAKNVNGLHILRNQFKNADNSDHGAVALSLTSGIANAEKRGNQTVSAPTNVSVDMTIAGNATASFSSSPVFQNSSLAVNGYSIDASSEPRLLSTTALTYSTTIATDASLADVYTITATNGTAFTISNPTNPYTGKFITYDILNSSGGSMGAITWGANFKLAGGTFTNPANTKRRTIVFRYDGTSWIEDRRASGDL